MANTLSKSAARGGAITLAGQATKITIQFLVLIVLGRLLGPEDFGLIVMVTAVVGVGELIRDFGLSAAAMQAKHVSPSEKTNLFWANTFIGLFLTIATCLLALPISVLYDDIRLLPIVLALSCTFAINGVQTQFQVELARNLKFGSLMVTDIIAQFAGLAAGIGFALAGAGYWSLVAQLLAIPLVLCVSRMGASGWWPSLPKRRVSIRPYLTYGWHLVVAQIVNYMSANAPSVLIGLQSGPSSLGNYNRAYQIVIVPISQVLAPFTNVLLPVLSRVQEDRFAFGEYVLRIQRTVGYLAAIAFAIVVAAAGSIVSIALGQGWEETAVLLTILAIGGAFQSLSFIGYWVFLSRAATKSLLHYNLVTKSMVLAFTLVGSLISVEAIAIGYSLGLALSWPICLLWLHRGKHIHATALWKSGLRILAVAFVGTVAGFTVGAFASLPSFLDLLLVSSTVICTSFLIMFTTKALRGDLTAILKVALLVLRKT